MGRLRVRIRLEDVIFGRPHVSGSYGKAEGLLDAIARPFAIDDDSVDPAVLRCRHFILDTSYFGGAEGEDLRRVASTILEEIRAA